MNACAEPISVKAQADSNRLLKPTYIQTLESLFFVWVGVFAGLSFLFLALLALSGLISLVQFAFFYGGISVMTAVLGYMLHVARTQAPETAADGQ